MMKCFELSVDFNGIVLFEPDRLVAYFGGSIDDGQNVYKAFTSSPAGDEVMEQGIVTPILGINDGFYKLFVRHSSEDAAIADDLVVFENGEFPLEVGKSGSVALADLAVLREWEDETGWNRIPITPGIYSILIRGFRRIENGELLECGYEFVLSSREALPRLTASLDKDVQVLCLPE